MNDITNALEIAEDQSNTAITFLTKDAEEDFANARSTLNDLIVTGQEALKGILDVAEDSDSPRAYEVVGQLIKHTADVSKNLVELQKHVQEMKQHATDGPGGLKSLTQHNAIFVGSSKDLLITTGS